MCMQTTPLSAKGKATKRPQPTTISLCGIAKDASGQDISAPLFNINWIAVDDEDIQPLTDAIGKTALEYYKNLMCRKA